MTSIKTKTTPVDDYGIREGTITFYATDERSQSKHLEIGSSWIVYVHGNPAVNDGASTRVGRITRVGRSQFDLVQGQEFGGTSSVYHTGGGTVASPREMAQRLTQWVIDDAEYAAEKAGA
jgi:hypothetical protein